MTSKVTVSAHCGADKRVVAELRTDGCIQPETTILQDGETAELLVYDDRVVGVREVDKG